MQPSARTPLYQVVLEVAALWLVANVGYYLFLPPLGINLSYNDSPFLLGAYFLAWLLAALVVFRDLLYEQLNFEKRIWVYLVQSFVFGSILYFALDVLSTFPTPKGMVLIPYSDIIFSTPYYFIPKAAEVLVQQVLIAALVAALSKVLSSVRGVSLAYAFLFGGAHALTYFLLGAPAPYGLVVTLGAFLSAAAFPYLILKVRSGFVYAYMLHLLFYVAAALAIHSWPPPGYF